MYTAILLSKHGQYVSHICDRRWLPAHPQHNTTNNCDDEIDYNNNTSMENSSNNITTTTTTTSNPGTTTNDSIIDNGPNDASHVVWAHGEFFYFSLRVFFILNIMDSYYWSIEVTEGLKEGSGEENGPKRRETRRAISKCFF